MLFLRLANKHLIFKVSVYKISNISKCYRSYNKRIYTDINTLKPLYIILPMFFYIRTYRMLTVKVNSLKQFLLKSKMNFAY